MTWLVMIRGAWNLRSIFPPWRRQLALAWWFRRAGCMGCRSCPVIAAGLTWLGLLL